MALKSAQKDLKDNYETFEIKSKHYKLEITELTELKTKQAEEEKKAKKREKKKLKKKVKNDNKDLLEKQRVGKADDKTITIPNVPVKNFYSCLETNPVEPTKSDPLVTLSRSTKDENSNETVLNDLEDNFGDELEEDLESEEWESLEEEQFDCYCGETFTEEDDIIFHRRTKHPDFRYSCKLCDLKLHNEDDHTQHRKSVHHRKLQVQLENNFNAHITSVCDICRISELKSDTSYIFCQNDNHMDTFHKIWNQVNNSDKPG